MLFISFIDYKYYGLINSLISIMTMLMYMNIIIMPIITINIIIIIIILRGALASWPEGRVAGAALQAHAPEGRVPIFDLRPRKS